MWYWEGNQLLSKVIDLITITWLQACDIHFKSNWLHTIYHDQCLNLVLRILSIPCKSCSSGNLKCWIAISKSYVFLYQAVMYIIQGIYQLSIGQTAGGRNEKWKYQTVYHLKNL